MYIHTQTDRQIDTVTQKHTDTQTDRQTYIHTQTDRQTYSQWNQKMNKSRLNF